MNCRTWCIRYSLWLALPLQACAHQATATRATLLPATPAAAAQRTARARVIEREPSLLSATPLAFDELYEKGDGLQPSRRALELSGQRVRMVGFMAKLELPPKDAFYFTAHPVTCDEAGGGTADLPPETVLVRVPSLHDEIVPHLSGGLEVVGRLEVGNQVDHDGRTSAFRIELEANEQKVPGETSTASQH